MTTKTKTTHLTTRTSKPAKPARRDRKPPGTRKAPASPAKRGRAALLPAWAWDWNQITYEPIDIRDLPDGALAMIYTSEHDRCFEGVIEGVWPSRHLGYPDSENPDRFDIDMTTRSGHLISIDARLRTTRAWRGMLSNGSKPGQ